MSPSAPNQITVEKSPSYFVHPEAPARLWRMSSKMRLMLIVRNPVKRAVSCYTMDVNQDLYKYTNGSFIPFQNIVLDSTGKIDPKSRPIFIGMYSVHLRKWLELFPKEQFHIIDGDSFAKNPVPELQNTERFLGLPPYFTDDKFTHDKNTSFYCVRKKRGQLKCPKHSHGHHFVSEEILQKLRDFYKPYNEEFFKLVGRRFDWNS